MKKQMTVVVSPQGTAAYAWLAKPDEGQQYSDGKYKVTLVLDKEDEAVAAFIEKLTKLATEIGTKEFGKLPKTFKMPYKDGDDQDKEEFKGHWLVVAKTKYQPGFVDAAKKALPDGVTPMSGDIIRASFGLTPYKAGGGIGVSCQLRNVMLIEKRNGGGGGDDFADLEAGEGFTGGADDGDNEEDFDI